jgi:hypothetical protein
MLHVPWKQALPPKPHELRIFPDMLPTPVGRVDHFPRGKGESAITENGGDFPTGLREAIGDRWHQGLALRLTSGGQKRFPN